MAKFKPNPAFMKKLIAIANVALDKTADESVRDMRAHWTPDGPSSPGEIPAIKTGRLDANIAWENITTNKLKPARRIGVKKGAVPYDFALEFGSSHSNLAPRPYIRPGIKRSKLILLKNAKQVFPS